MRNSWDPTLIPGVTPRLKPAGYRVDVGVGGGGANESLTVEQ